MRALRSRRALPVAIPLAVAGAAAAAVLVPSFAGGSSHREAPAISQDPTADSTDVYAFRSPDAPNTATIVANYVPFEEPAGGPTFYRFSDDVGYRILVDNTGDGRGDVVYEFRFKTKVKTPESFLYNTGPVTFSNGQYTNLNLNQTYTVRKITYTKKGRQVVKTLGRDLLTPPNNVGPKSTPNYTSLVSPSVYSLKDGVKVFAGQRDDPFFADLGSIFDLVNLRSAPPATFSSGGIDNLKHYSVNSMVIQVPIGQLTRKGNIPGPDINDTSSVVGVYATASRPVVRFNGKDGKPSVRYQQVSRLAQPLQNELLIPLGQKDRWNASSPSDDAQFARYYRKPELAGALNAFFALGSPTDNRNDLVTILLKGIPPNNGLGLPTTQIGNKPALADLARINLAVPPTPFAQQNRLGLLGGQADGHPNGRRLVDDTVDIAERAVAGVLATPFGVPAPNGPNKALVPLLGDGVNANDLPFLPSFPYLATPISGFDARPGS